MNFKQANERVARSVVHAAWKSAAVGGMLGAFLTVAAFLRQGFGIGTIVLAAASCYAVAGGSFGMLVGVLLGRKSTLSLQQIGEWIEDDLRSTVREIEIQGGLYTLYCPRCRTLCDAVELDDLEDAADCACENCGFCFRVSGGDTEPQDEPEETA